MSTKEAQEKLIDNMERWMKVEDLAVKTTGEIAEKSPNPLIKHVMTIIKRDSEMHHRTQQLIIDLVKGTATMTPDELADVWDQVEKHIETEVNAVEMARAAKEVIKGKKMKLQEYLIEYLLVDEEKHNELLDKLRLIKEGMYPYG